MSLTNASPLDAAREAASAARQLATLPDADRRLALTALHDALRDHKDAVLAANRRDVDGAARLAADGKLSQALVKRLDLSKPGKYEDMLQGVLDVRDLEDPLGRLTMRTLLDDGMVLERVTCPIGVLLVIFEARPEVIVNIAALAIKSGNAAILKGGKESTDSFVAISSIISQTVLATAVPPAAIQLVTTRDAIAGLLAQDRYIDLVIPRGSNELVRYVKEHTKIPVLGHADGLCSIYIHPDADPALAARVVADAKTNYPAACNAVETLLVHEDALATVFPAVARALLAQHVQLRCDAASKAAVLAHAADAVALAGDGDGAVRDATDADYATEFLDLILAVKTVPSAEAALAHIHAHSSKHTEAVLTASRAVAEHFLAACDSAGVYWNASTRMADGMRYGFGTEVGISTNKIHSRGPVGLEGLTIYKYLIRGDGHVAGDYTAEGGRTWKHQKMEI
ncbi:hypothetical protein KEM52_006489 [Ascosphaera acerosa]|nr:hypothetical protein KEM52_006489 [Ascosphaera acerosa]